MDDTCELCRSGALKFLYKPEPSPRGIVVHVCTQCGLVQSLPRAERTTRSSASVSGGADWGNIRYGKAFRTGVAMDAIGRHADLGSDLSVLDVGSNRGSFVRALTAAAPNANIVAVEPDERVSASCAKLDRVELIEARIEDVALETGRFDIVHSCHTIEHLANPARVLADHWRVLKDGGLLVLDAPNIALLNNDDIVEEWFIDKHLYHFSEQTLRRMIEQAGFEILQAPDPGDRSNLFFVARKCTAAGRMTCEDAAEAGRSEDLVAAYVATRARNLMALTAVAAEISQLAHRGVALWGAGRLFDSLVVHGRFNPRTLTLLIDSHLKPLVQERHGCPVAGPDALARSDAGVVVVMSRDFAGEIAQQARALSPHAEIVLYKDLITRARTRMAA